MELTRKEALHKAIVNDVDNILCDHPERVLYDILENGCEAYSKWEDKDIIEYFNDFLDEKLVIIE